MVQSRRYAAAIISLFLALSSQASITQNSLEQSIASHQKEFPELVFIQQFAEHHGFRAWLGGGYAAARLRFEVWDLEQQQGSTQFPQGRFEYVHDRVMRSTQDADIFIDGSANQAHELEQALATQFPFMRDQKSIWEVKPLYEERDGKLPVFNSDFLDQNTDSHSVGAVEITNPPPHQSRIRDLKNWDSTHSQFAEEMIHHEIHFLKSPIHFQTKKASQGENPEIIGVVRFLTKAFQGDIPISRENEELIRPIIEGFRAEDVANWPKSTRISFENNVKKMFLNALDFEKAVNTLDEIHFREKLKRIGNLSDGDSVAYLANKEPLRSYPVGLGEGETAEQLGISDITHNTRSEKVLEQILEGYPDKPNFAISRASTSLEVVNKDLGDGTYFFKGKTSTRGGEYPIHAKLKPDAQEGRDFVFKNDELVVKNRAKIELQIDETTPSPIQFFQKVVEVERGTRSQNLDWLRRRMTSRIGKLSPEEQSALAQYVADILGDPPLIDVRSTPSGQTWIIRKSKVLEEWNRTPLAAKFREVGLADRENPYTKACEQIIQGKFDIALPANQALLIEMSRRSPSGELLSLVGKEVLSKPEARGMDDFFNSYMKDGGPSARYSLLSDVYPAGNLTQPERFLTEIVKDDPNAANTVLDSYLANNRQRLGPEADPLLQAILDSGRADNNFARRILGNPGILSRHPEWLEQLVARTKVTDNGTLMDLARSVFRNQEARNQSQAFREFFEKARECQECTNALVGIFYYPESREFDQTLASMVRRGMRYEDASRALDLLKMRDEKVQGSKEFFEKKKIGMSTDILLSYLMSQNHLEPETCVANELREKLEGDASRP